MKTTHFVTTLAAGIGAGIAFIMSCGDSPKPADAGDSGMCNCPAAEPPLASRITEHKMNFTIPANTTRDSHSIGCPDTTNDIVLNGGCLGSISDDVVLRQSYPVKGGWVCAWGNNTNADVTVTVVVNCLAPAT